MQAALTTRSAETVSSPMDIGTRYLRNHAMYALWHIPSKVRWCMRKVTTAGDFIGYSQHFKFRSALWHCRLDTTGIQAANK